jgi:hypothetical protein
VFLAQALALHSWVHSKHSLSALQGKLVWRSKCLCLVRSGFKAGLAHKFGFVCRTFSSVVNGLSHYWFTLRQRLGVRGGQTSRLGLEVHYLNLQVVECLQLSRLGLPHGLVVTTSA